MRRFWTLPSVTVEATSPCPAFKLTPLCSNCYRSPPTAPAILPCEQRTEKWVKFRSVSGEFKTWSTIRVAINRLCEPSASLLNCCKVSTYSSKVATCPASADREPNLLARQIPLHQLQVRSSPSSSHPWRKSWWANQIPVYSLSWKSGQFSLVRPEISSPPQEPDTQSPLYRYSPRRNSPFDWI